MKYTSAKKIGPITTGHRQWKDGGHCSYIHGYGRYVVITFACYVRDEKGWVMDFGDLRDVKKWIEDEWDHRVLIAYDDPLLNELQELHNKGGIDINILPTEYGPGIEDSCKYIYDNINPMIVNKTDDRVWVEKIRVYEHENNWAEFEI